MSGQLPVSLKIVFVPLCVPKLPLDSFQIRNDFLLLLLVIIVSPACAVCTFTNSGFLVSYRSTLLTQVSFDSLSIYI